MFRKLFKDRDYLLTVEGLFFCVVGYVHPSDRVISYPKYVPKKKTGEENIYKRILPFYTIQCLKDALNYLRKEYPHYIFQDETSNLEFSAVPLQNIKEHLCPEQGFIKLLHKDRKDSLESKAVEAISTLAECSGVRLDFFGITGSILLGIHNPKFSDVDIIVYGRNNSLKVKETLLEFYKNQKSDFKKFFGEKLKNWCRDKARLYPLSEAEAEKLYRRIWNRGIYKETFFSIHPTRLDEEVKEKYGEKIFSQNGLIEIEATVKNVEESMFIPSVYGVEDVTVRSGLKVDVVEVVSYEGLYGGIFEEDERIVVKGVLEKVEERKTKEFYWRVVVGSLKAEGKDYIKPKSFFDV